MPVWREQQETSWEAWTSSKIASAYTNLSQNDKAIESFERALTLHQTAKNRSGEADVMMRLGIIRLRSAKYAKSIEYLQKALEINREIKNRLLEGQMPVYMGLRSRK